MAALDNALTTLDRAKAFIGDIDGSGKDLILTMLILGATQYIQDTHCKRKFAKKTYSSEVYDGKGQKRLWLKQKPVLSTETVIVQRRSTIENDDDWDTVDSDDYFVDYPNGCIEMVGGVFAKGVQNYRVTYTAGYILPGGSGYQDGTNDELDLPADLELAALQLVSDMYSSRGTAGIQRQRVGEVEITYATVADEDPQIKATLDKYKTKSYG